jgi:hypothetical protein
MKKRRIFRLYSSAFKDKLRYLNQPMGVLLHIMKTNEHTAKPLGCEIRGRDLVLEFPSLSSSPDSTDFGKLFNLTDLPVSHFLISKMSHLNQMLLVLVFKDL